MNSEVPPGTNSSEPKISRRTSWMVVDDDESVTDFLAALLEELGVAEVRKFNCPQAALAAFLSQPHQFDFVITDLEMPGMNGIELCHRLREAAPDVKVVLATGSGIPNDADILRNGFCGFLAKPFPAAKFWRTIQAAGLMSPNSSSPNN